MRAHNNVHPRAILRSKMALMHKRLTLAVSIHKRCGHCAFTSICIMEHQPTNSDQQTNPKRCFLTPPISLQTDVHAVSLFLHSLSPSLSLFFFSFSRSSSFSLCPSSSSSPCLPPSPSLSVSNQLFRSFPYVISCPFGLFRARDPMATGACVESSVRMIDIQM